MLIPSIDLMGGKIVQLVQGKHKALEFNDLEEWIARFSSFPLVQVIDLDAAMDNGDNSDLVCRLTRRLPCQVGGGIRSIERAVETLARGARRVILGSSLINNGVPNITFAETIARLTGPDKLVFAIDSKQGRIAIRGWRECSAITPLKMIAALEMWCGAFLYTDIDTEGLMQGIPLDTVRQLRECTKKQLIVAGGIATYEEIQQLHELRIDAVVGMAIYTGKLGLHEGTVKTPRRLREQSAGP